MTLSLVDGLPHYLCLSVSVCLDPLYPPCPGLLIGGVVIADMVKPETPQAVQMLHRMGLKVVLVTGDNRRTAHAVAEEVKNAISHDIMNHHVIPHDII